MLYLSRFTSLNFRNSLRCVQSCSSRSGIGPPIFISRTEGVVFSIEVRRRNFKGDPGGVVTNLRFNDAWVVIALGVFLDCKSVRASTWVVVSCVPPGCADVLLRIPCGAQGISFTAHFLSIYVTSASSFSWSSSSNLVLSGTPSRVLGASFRRRSFACNPWASLIELFPTAANRCE